ncbi:mitochondrial carrier domain-containing protein [Cystoisospora suis]|uniref:Mitochondrial carrier domain-containing protein n=1 Tax=Cystoisospora suis TaxID=483139 RepID=A0A2C6L5C8_9APIC|nr:mitochondrial carrier domain-containing protein [Cystoisospora suis]
MQLKGASNSRSASSFEDAAPGGTPPVIGSSLALLSRFQVAQLRFLLSRSCLQQGQSARAESLVRQAMLSSLASPSSDPPCSPSASVLAPSCSSLLPVPASVSSSALDTQECRPVHAACSHALGDRTAPVVCSPAEDAATRVRHSSGERDGGTCGQLPSACSSHSHASPSCLRDSTAVPTAPGSSTDCGLVLHTSGSIEPVSRYQRPLAPNERREAAPCSRTGSGHVGAGVASNVGKGSSFGGSNHAGNVLADDETVVTPHGSVSGPDNSTNNNRSRPGCLFNSASCSYSASKAGGDASAVTASTGPLLKLAMPASPGGVLSGSPARGRETLAVSSVTTDSTETPASVAGCPLFFGSSPSSLSLQECLLSGLLLRSPDFVHTRLAAANSTVASPSPHFPVIDAGAPELTGRLSALRLLTAATSLVYPRGNICSSCLPSPFGGADPYPTPAAVAASSMARQGLLLLSALARCPSAALAPGSQPQTGAEREGTSAKAAERREDILGPLRLLASTGWAGQKQVTAEHALRPDVRAGVSGNTATTSSRSGEFLSFQQVRVVTGTGGERATRSDDRQGGAAAVSSPSSTDSSDKFCSLTDYGRAAVLSSSSDGAGVAHEPARSEGCCDLTCVPDTINTGSTKGHVLESCSASLLRAGGDVRGEKTVDGLVSQVSLSSVIPGQTQPPRSGDEKRRAASSRASAPCRRTVSAVSTSQPGADICLSGSSSLPGGSGQEGALRVEENSASLQEREGENVPTCSLSSGSSSVQNPSRWPSSLSGRPVFSYVERHPRLAHKVRAVPDEEEEEDKEDVEISIFSSEAGACVTETEEISMETGRPGQGRFSKSHTPLVAGAPCSSSALSSHPPLPAITAKGPCEKSGDGGDVRNERNGTDAVQREEESDVAPSSGATAAGTGRTQEYSLETNEDETGLTVLSGVEPMTEAERTAAAAEVARIPTVTLTELVRAAVMPLRIEGMHALEQEQLLHGRKAWLRYECPLCDKTVHAPDAYWSNYEHYIRHHWRSRRTLGGYVCFPCRRKHDPLSVSSSSAASEVFRGPSSGRASSRGYSPSSSQVSLQEALCPGASSAFSTSSGQCLSTRSFSATSLSSSSSHTAGTCGKLGSGVRRSLSAQSNNLKGRPDALATGGGRGRSVVPQYHFHCPLCPCVFPVFSDLQVHAFEHHRGSAADPRLKLVPQLTHTPWIGEAEEDYTIQLKEEGKTKSEVSSTAGNEDVQGKADPHGNEDPDGISCKGVQGAARLKQEVAEEAEPEDVQRAERWEKLTEEVNQQNYGMALCLSGMPHNGKRGERSVRRPASGPPDVAGAAVASATETDAGSGNSLFASYVPSALSLAPGPVTKENGGCSADVGVETRTSSTRANNEEQKQLSSCGEEQKGLSSCGVMPVIRTTDSTEGMTQSRMSRVADQDSDKEDSGALHGPREQALNVCTHVVAARDPMSSSPSCCRHGASRDLTSRLQSDTDEVHGRCCLRLSNACKNADAPDLCWVLPSVCQPPVSSRASPPCQLKSCLSRSKTKVNSALPPATGDSREADTSGEESEVKATRQAVAEEEMVASISCEERFSGKVEDGGPRFLSSEGTAVPRRGAEEKKKKRVEFSVEVRVRPLDKELSIMEKLGAVMGPVLTGLSYSPSASTVGSDQASVSEVPTESRSASSVRAAVGGDFPRRGTRSATAAAKAAGGAENPDRPVSSASSPSCPSAPGSVVWSDKSNREAESPGREKGAGKTSVSSRGDTQNHGSTGHVSRNTSSASRGPRGDVCNAVGVVKDTQLVTAAAAHTTNSSRRSWKGGSGSAPQRTAPGSDSPASPGRAAIEEETQTKFGTNRGRAVMAAEAGTARRIAAARGAVAAAEAALNARQGRTKWEGTPGVQSVLSVSLCPSSVRDEVPSRYKTSPSSTADGVPTAPANVRSCIKSEHGGIAGPQRRQKPGALVSSGAGGGKRIESQRGPSEKGGMDQVVVLLSSSDDDEPRGRRSGRGGNNRRQGAILAVGAGDLTGFPRQSGLPLPSPTVRCLAAANCDSCTAGAAQETFPSSLQSVSPSPTWSASSKSSSDVASAVPSRGPAGASGGAGGSGFGLYKTVPLSVATKNFLCFSGTEGESERTPGCKKRKRHLLFERKRRSPIVEEEKDNGNSYASSSPSPLNNSMLGDAPECQGDSLQKRGFPRPAETSAAGSLQKEDRNTHTSVVDIPVTTVAVQAVAAASASHIAGGTCNEQLFGLDRKEQPQSAAACSWEKEDTTAGHGTSAASRAAAPVNSGSEQLESPREEEGCILSQSDKARLVSQSAPPADDGPQGLSSVGKSRRLCPRIGDLQPCKHRSVGGSWSALSAGRDTRRLSKSEQRSGQGGKTKTVLIQEKGRTERAGEEPVESVHKKGGALDMLVAVPPCPARETDWSETAESAKTSSAGGADREGERKNGRHAESGGTAAAKHAASVGFPDASKSLRKLSEEKVRLGTTLRFCQEFSAAESTAQLRAGERQAARSPAACRRAARSVSFLSGGGSFSARKNLSDLAVARRLLSSAAGAEKKRRRSGTPHSAEATAIETDALRPPYLHAVLDCPHVSESGRRRHRRQQPSYTKKTADTCDSSPFRQKHQNFSLQRRPALHQLKGSPRRRQHAVINFVDVAACCASSSKKGESSLPRRLYKRRGSLPVTEPGLESGKANTCCVDFKIPGREVWRSSLGNSKRTSGKACVGETEAEPKSVSESVEDAATFENENGRKWSVSEKCEVPDKESNRQPTDSAGSARGISFAAERKPPAGRYRVATKAEHDVTREQTKSGRAELSSSGRPSPDEARRPGAEDPRVGDNEASDGGRCKAVRIRDIKSMQRLLGERGSFNGMDENNRRAPRIAARLGNAFRSVSQVAEPNPNGPVRRNVGDRRGLGTGGAPCGVLHGSSPQLFQCGEQDGSSPGNYDGAQTGNRRGEVESSCQGAGRTDRGHRKEDAVVEERRENLSDGEVKPLAGGQSEKREGTEETSAGSCSQGVGQGRSESQGLSGGVLQSRPRKRRSSTAINEEKVGGLGPSDIPNEEKTRAAKKGKRVEGKGVMQGPLKAVEHTSREGLEESGEAELWATAGPPTSRHASA